jgi:hypothetical protein
LGKPQRFHRCTRSPNAVCKCKMCTSAFSMDGQRWFRCQWWSVDSPLHPRRHRRRCLTRDRLHRPQWMSIWRHHHRLRPLQRQLLVVHHLRRHPWSSGPSLPVVGSLLAQLMPREAASSSLATVQIGWHHLPPPMGGPNGPLPGLWRFPLRWPVWGEGRGRRALLGCGSMSRPRDGSRTEHGTAGPRVGPARPYRRGRIWHAGAWRLWPGDAVARRGSHLGAAHRAALRGSHQARTRARIWARARDLAREAGGQRAQRGHGGTRAARPRPALGPHEQNQGAWRPCARTSGDSGQWRARLRAGKDARREPPRGELGTASRGARRGAPPPRGALGATPRRRSARATVDSSARPPGGAQFPTGAGTAGSLAANDPGDGWELGSWRRLGEPLVLDGGWGRLGLETLAAPI